MDGLKCFGKTVKGEGAMNLKKKPLELGIYLFCVGTFVNIDKTDTYNTQNSEQFVNHTKCYPMCLSDQPPLRHPIILFLN